MSETKYTPGPWGRHCSNVETTHIITADNEGNPNGIIATLSRVAWCNDGEHQANARLIASAPELLAALEWLVDEFNSRTALIDITDDEKAAIKAANDALAKAKGQL